MLGFLTFNLAEIFLATYELSLIQSTHEIHVPVYTLIQENSQTWFNLNEGFALNNLHSNSLL